MEQKCRRSLYTNRVFSSIQSTVLNILYISFLIPSTISKAFRLASSLKYRFMYNEPIAKAKLKINRNRTNKISF